MSRVKLRQKLAQAKKKREKDPRPVAKSLAPVSKSAMQLHQGKNLGILFSIESTILRCAQEDPRIDDRVALSCLRGVILSDPPSQMPEAWLFSEIVASRSSLNDLDEVQEEDSSESDWNECLRMVSDSIRRHSSLTPGETTYIDFVRSQFPAGAE